MLIQALLIKFIQTIPSFITITYKILGLIGTKMFLQNSFLTFTISPYLRNAAKIIREIHSHDFLIYNYNASVLVG
jgi:predicted tellurium resistance membrane protein TerC